MNFWDFLHRRLEAREIKRSGIVTPESWLLEAESVPSTTGISVTEESSLNATAVFACVRILAGILASLPCHLMQRTAKGKRRATEHPLYHLLHDEPNPEMTSFQWREASMAGVLLWGNAYSYIELDPRAGRVAALWPITSDRVTTKRNDARDIVHDVTTVTTGQTVTVPAEEMLHLPGLGFDGVVGKSVVGMHREAIGLALATEKHGAAFFGNGGRPSFVLEHPGHGDKKTAETIRRAWSDQHGGPNNLQRFGVLFDGMKLNTYSMPHDDAQFLETRQYQTAEIAGRMFGIPLWMIGEHSKDTSWGTGVEQQFIAFSSVTLSPWAQRIAAGMTRALLSPEDIAAGYFVYLDLKGLLRGDFKTRVEGYHNGITDGWMTRNEARELEDMDLGPDDLDEFLVAQGGSSLQPARSGRGREQFGPLIEHTWTRVFRRGMQDAQEGFKPERWEADIQRYAWLQFVPVYRAMNEPPDLEALVQWLRHADNPAQWDPQERAQRATAALLGD